MKKIIYCLYAFSVFGYVSAFVVLFATHMSFEWNSQNEILQGKLFAGFFLMGAVCAEISMFLRMSEKNIWTIEEEKETFSEEEIKKIKKLLSEFDD